MKETIEKFIRENELNFNSSGSGLNGAYTVVCGYADHVGASKKSVKEAVIACTGVTALGPESKKELDKVYNFASTYNYGKWWTSLEASRTYKF
jgi:riboflavin synthase